MKPTVNKKRTHALAIKGDAKMFASAWSEIIDGQEYIRCRYANGFIRKIRAKCPAFYAMRVHNNHHYIPVKTFVYYVGVQLQKRYRVQV